ncbi:MAG: SdpI family protein [Ignavibacteriae bacterium]|nr:SdpI family protein [Ignavibacteriota bacterium]
MEILFLISGFVGILMIALSIPLILQKVKINHWYGIRLPETMKDEKVWFETNRLGGKYLFNNGVIIVIISMVLYFQKIIPNIYAFIFITIFIYVSVIGVTIKSSKLATTISKKKIQTVLK